VRRQVLQEGRRVHRRGRGGRQRGNKHPTSRRRVGEATTVHNLLLLGPYPCLHGSSGIRTGGEGWQW
jgi:hypothetical protein